MSLAIYSKYVSMFFLVATILISLALSGISFLHVDTKSTAPIPFPITENFDAALEQRDLTMYNNNVSTIQSSDGVTNELDLTNAHPIETHVQDEPQIVEHAQYEHIQTPEQHGSNMGTPVKNEISSPISATNTYSYGQIFNNLFSIQDTPEQFDLISNY
jgi:hypothetical protein